MGEILSQGPLFLVCLIFMMGIVVIVHELGHYLVGRWFGAAVESFSIGFGKPVFERKDKHGTRWRVNWIPLGGFVKFVGESQLASDVGKIESGPVGKAYNDLGVGQRSLVSLAGPFANFILSTLIFALIIGVHGRPDMKVGIASVVEGGAAEAGGMEAGDVVLEVNGKSVSHVSEVLVAIILNPNEPMDFLVQRDAGQESLVITPEEIVRENDFGQKVPQATIGVSITPISFGEHITYNPVEALGQGVIETGATIDRTVTMLTRIVTGKMSMHAMTGPVGIGDISRRAVNQVWEQEQMTTSQKLSQLFWMLASICAAISVGVGFFNLLPLPVLDGGHLVFNAYEAIAGREMPQKVQEVALTFGLILLLGMVVVITWGDLIETGLFGARGG
ncbi:RIP metalloprotease [Hyphomonas sp.]|uniref:M50 family metallopeptidase n=1 Tax=Hyphomonas sp. TaxID=87 RepID=UPI0025C190A7|nr:RIP metalloprotease [Hyphomonas sp.]